MIAMPLLIMHRSPERETLVRRFVEYGWKRTANESGNARSDEQEFDRTANYREDRCKG